MPTTASVLSQDDFGLVTDVTQTVNQEFYEWLLEQHNYFPDCTFNKDTIMREHSYTRNWKAKVSHEFMETRTILVHPPPQCPFCHQLPPNHDEKARTPEAINIPIQFYNNEACKGKPNVGENLITIGENQNSDSDDWTENIQKSNWTEQQRSLFERIERILDMDQLGRLAASGLSSEQARRNSIMNKSVSRMRAALASVHWSPQLVKWLHEILMNKLPTMWLVSYIEILQMLKHKMPTLVDKFLYDTQKDYINAINMPWKPVIVNNPRELPNNPAIVFVSSTVCSGIGFSRENRWMELLQTLSPAKTVLVNIQEANNSLAIEEVIQQLVEKTRTTIQEIRTQTPDRDVILVGVNSTASLVLQIGIIEPVNFVVCLGFAFNTLNGVRGMADDHILNLLCPVLFVIGEHSQRSSPEEVDSFREKMLVKTRMVIVGSSDDALRVKRSNRSMEGVYQSMVDNMITDEIYEFGTSCILNPPATKPNTPIKRVRLSRNQRFKLTGQLQKTRPSYKNKTVKSEISYGLLQENGNADSKLTEIAHAKIQYVPTNQFVHLKPPTKNMQKIYVKQRNGNRSYTLVCH